MQRIQTDTIQKTQECCQQFQIYDRWSARLSTTYYFLTVFIFENENTGQICVRAIVWDVGRIIQRDHVGRAALSTTVCCRVLTTARRCGVQQCKLILCQEPKPNLNVQGHTPPPLIATGIPSVNIRFNQTLHSVQGVSNYYYFHQSFCCAKTMSPSNINPKMLCLRVSHYFVY